MDEITIEQIADKIKKRFVDNESIKSFQDFLACVARDPDKYCRSAAQYLKDVFDYYGYTETRDINGDPIKRWNLFNEFGPVCGQERSQNQIYTHLSSYAKKRVNKIILLHGPNGSAKTSLIAAIIAATEEYSKTPEGTVYTFNWIFSDRGDKPTGLGFGGPSITNEGYDEETLAFVKPEDITFKLACGMKDNPLFLIPKEERLAFLKSLGMEKVPTHLLEGELNQKSHEIFEQLKISYKGDWKKIIRHIQVERFYFSKRFRKGLISIDPQKNVDASSRPLNLENSYRIPPVLSMTSIHEPVGDLIDANRGLVEFSEIFKRHPETNKYLLTTAEWGTINLPNFTGYLDCVIFATDNESQLSHFKMDPDWPSFNGRFAYVRVPYLLQWSKEKELYARAIKDLNKVSNKYVAPYTVEFIALWSVMTRLRASKEKLAKNLNHLEKAILYDSGQAPDSWKDDNRKLLLSKLNDITNEFVDSRDRKIESNYGGYLDASYEGRSGASYREVELVLLGALHNNIYNHLSPLSLIESIFAISKDKSVYEFLKLPKELGYIETEKSLLELEDYFVHKTQKDLRDSAGLISQDQYLQLFKNYLVHVKAWIRSEKIQNTQTGTWDDPNQSLLDNVETLLEIDEDDRKEWREGAFNKIASWSLDHRGESIPYGELFSDSLEILKTASHRKHREQLLSIMQGILKKGSEDWDTVSSEDQELVLRTIDNMTIKGYDNDYLKEVIVFLLQHEGD